MLSLQGINAKLLNEDSSLQDINDKNNVEIVFL